MILIRVPLFIYCFPFRLTMCDVINLWEAACASAVAMGNKTDECASRAQSVVVTSAVAFLALVPGFGEAAIACTCMGVVARDAGVDDNDNDDKPTTAAPVPPIIASGVFEAHQATIPACNISTKHEQEIGRV